MGTRQLQCGAHGIVAGEGSPNALKFSTRGGIKEIFQLAFLGIAWSFQISIQSQVSGDSRSQSELAPRVSPFHPAVLTVGGALEDEGDVVVDVFVLSDHRQPVGALQRVR